MPMLASMNRDTATEDERLAQLLEQCLGKLGDRLGLGMLRADHAELVATEAAEGDLPAPGTGAAARRRA